ncbi:tubby-related protein 4-like isoform X2 [Ornithodoros turicata]|uniref:tubby-related protein 4-like isoform X2 n=1 Tax=Ornithodoros turicata TaxID=34597 RepID=UPI003139FE96
MHLHFERSLSSRADCSVLSLTWMGKVPDELPEEDGWRLNRVNYYQDGWLASGNDRGIVGVTFTTCHCRKATERPVRTNYNLRGHRSEVTLVKWNEPYQKLASCDSSGIIFVWIKYEGRWSIELINDRNTQVTDFAWSHDGRMALICYRDGFVLVGSVAGQRYWSSMLNLDAVILTGIWAPDDHQVLFGTSNGQILVNDVHGEEVAQLRLVEGAAIVGMTWSCEKFKMEETDGEPPANAVPTLKGADSKMYILAVCFSNGVIHIMKNYDDVSPTIINTGLKDIKSEWSNSGEVLAVAGVTTESTECCCRNTIHFYTNTGRLRFVATIPYTQNPVTAMTWGHNDKRLFVATGSIIHIGWVTRRIASLQLLSRLTLHRSLADEDAVHRLPLPRRLRALVASLFGQTFKCYLPEPKRLRDFVSRPPSQNIRLHCTMVRHDTEDLVTTGSVTYTLFLEYLGGLVPLLKGKRASNLRPEFVIYDPQGRSESEGDDSCTSSPRMTRRNKNGLKSGSSPSPSRRKELLYVDELPEQDKIVAVTSNLWGTKFKIMGLVPWLPPVLGVVTYRTSLLHLQPRRMTLVIKELQGPQLCGGARSPTLVLHNEGSSGLSEDEDFVLGPEGLSCEESAPIAPMTPKKVQRYNPPVCCVSGTVHADPGRSDGTDEGNSECPGCPASEEYLTIETTSDTSAPVLSLRALGLVPPQCTVTSVATQTSLPDTRTDLSIFRGQASGNSLGDVVPSTSAVPCESAQGTPRTATTRWAEKAGEIRFIDEENLVEAAVADIHQSSVLHIGHRTRGSGLLPPSNTSACARRLTLQNIERIAKPQAEPLYVSDSAERPLIFADENPFVCTAECPDRNEHQGDSLDSSPAGSPRHCSPVWLGVHGGSLPRIRSERLSDESSAPPSPPMSRSNPSSPLLSTRKHRQNQLKTLLYSPLLMRRSRRALESSDEEGSFSSEERNSDGFKVLESMQKANIRKKLKKRHGRVHLQEMLPPQKPPPLYREFLLHNKAPIWNEVSQVYQLDFGGRVTQESAKNFQIEFKGNQVMQFGRIDGNAYTLDFQYPFSALQAFAVALANVTQRLK